MDADLKLNRGFLLTSHFYDTREGLELGFYGKSEDGPFKLVFKNQKIIFFIPRDAKFNPSIKFERKSQNLKNFTHDSVDTIYLNKYSDIQIIKDYCEMNGVRTFELDVHPTERFLMERFINGEVEFKGVSSRPSAEGVETYINPEIRKSGGSTYLSLMSLDIETGVGGEVYSIGIHHRDKNGEVKKVLMLNDSTSIYDDLLSFHATEKELLLSFITLFRKLDPDLIIGWHVIGFDFKFLQEKCERLGIEFTIGRDKKKLRISEKKGMGFFADLPGRAILDGPPVLRSAFYQFKNFKLETVASAVVGAGKDIASDGGKVSEIERRFKEDKPALAKYNLLDCTLVIDIFDKLKLIDFLVRRVHISGLLFGRLGVSTAAFDHIFLPRLHRKGYVAPNRIEIVRDEAGSGGMVIEPVAGMHKNVAIFDFTSLYPSIMRTFKIDPYSRIQAGVDTISTPNGIHFSNSENILPSLIGDLLYQRAQAKMEKNGALSQAIKILMNSFYGIMGSSRCRFYHSDLPKAITETGHWILKTSIEFFENRGHKVLYGDTDSIFIQMEERHLKDKEYVTNIISEINEFLGILISDEYKVDSYLECEFEKMYDRIYFAKMRSGEGAAKKKYAGFLNGKLEFKGMESVRSDWTELAKKFQKGLYQNFFTDTEIESYIKSYIKDVEEGKFDFDLVYTKRLSKDPKEYTKNIPPHVRAALKINHTGPYRLKEVSYVMTKNGPEPVVEGEDKIFDYDYQHYIEKQLAPIADDILFSMGKSFDSFIVGDQLNFF